MVLAVVLAVALIDASKINLFSYHAWRQTQTFASTACFAEAGWSEMFACFFAPQIGTGPTHFVGLEAPVLSFLQYIIYPNEAPEHVSSGLIWLGAAVVFLVVLLYASVKERTVVNAALGVGLALCLLRSPTFIFFERSFQPNIFAFAFVLVGMVAAELVETNGAKRLWLAVCGIGVTTYPHLAVLVAIIPFWMRNREFSAGLSARLACELFFDLVVLFLPMAVFVAGGLVLLFAGQASLYHHAMLPLTETLSNPHLLPTFWDQIALSGVGLVAAFLVAIGFNVLVLVQMRAWGRITVVAWPFVAFVVVFLAAFQLFFENTYYGYNLIATLVAAYVLSIPGDANPRPTSGCSRVPAVAALFCFVFVAPELVSPISRDWSSSYIYVQLRQQSPRECQPAGARRLADLVPSWERLALSCSPADPSCRTAANYRGDGIGAQGPEFLAHLADLQSKGGFYLRCVHPQETSVKVQAEVVGLAEPKSVREDGDWLLFGFAP